MTCSSVYDRSLFLFISNGHGEDLIGASIAKSLCERLPMTETHFLCALPLVGKGQAYLSAQIPLLYAGQEMPSGGFVMRPKDLWEDICAGFLSLTRQQWIHAWKIRQQVKAVIAIGDTYPLLMSLWFRHSKKIFVSSAKSSYVGTHSSLELWAMKRGNHRVFPRDAYTDDYLKKEGVLSEYVGNVMMDMCAPTGENFGLTSSDVVIGILPGSRKEAYQNLELIAQVCQVLRQRPLNSPLVFLMACPDTLELVLCQKIMQYAEDVIFTSLFGDVLNKSHVIIGLAGTANEQGVGCGVPVVAFPGVGPQTSHYRFRLQSRMLGGSVFLSR